MKFEELRIKEVHSVVRYLPKATRWKNSNRRDHIIGLQLNGTGLHDFGYQRLTLTTGCVYFFNQRDDYAVELEKSLPNESFSVHFTTFEEIDGDSFALPVSNSAEILHLLEKIEMQKMRMGTDDLALIGLVYQLCAEIQRIRRKPYMPQNLRLLTAKEYLDLHFKEEGCLDAASGICGISRRRFNDLFKASFDLTPNRYLTLRKIGFAKELLQTGGFSMAEVAELCGFEDIYYFSKVFKDETGLPPGKWQKNGR